MEKITRKSVLNKVVANEDGIFSAEEIAIAQKMIASLEKKYASNGKPTKRQVENQEIAEAIRTYLNENAKATPTEIGNAIGQNCQRTSAVLKQMEVPKIKEKGKMYYGWNVVPTADDGGEDE